MNKPRRSDTVVSNDHLLIEALPSTSRLALAYAPLRARQQTLALLALDARLAHLLRHSREPMMAQLRFAWWRETLNQQAAQWPDGEPLLAVLKSWNGHHRHLVGLVDGWENLTGAAPLQSEALQAMAQGRSSAFAALATVLGTVSATSTVAAVATSWAFHDLATHLGNPDERARVVDLAKRNDVKSARLPRSVRPLQVLHTVARDLAQRGGGAGILPPATLVKAMRVGMLGI